MPKHSVIIKSLHVSIIIKSNKKEDIRRIRNSSFLRRYIPSCEIINSESKTDCILFLARGSANININYPIAKYCGNKIDIKDVVSLAEYLLERARQEKGIYCLHGSVCVIRNKAVIFWGAVSGMGKTSLCKELNDNYSAEWLADEKILIDLKKELMVGFVDTAYIKNGSHHTFYTLKSSNDNPIPIAFFVQPHLSGSSDSDIKFIKWGESKFRWHLYEELNRKIRATSRIFFNCKMPVLPIDTIKLAKKRLNEISRFSQKIDCYYLRGNAENICGKIIKLSNSGQS